MKILVINIKYLGDLIVSSPGIRHLRVKYPGAEIVFLLRKEFEDVLKNNSNIDKIISFDPDLEGNSGIGKIFDGIKFIKKIRDEKFDVVISLHPGDRTAIWAWFSGARIRIAPGKQSFSFLFNRVVEVYEDTISYLEYYNRLIAEFTGNFKEGETEFFIPSEFNDWADNYLIENNLETGCELIGIHPGASEPTKIWPSDNFIELIDQLIKNKKLNIILIEGPQDKIICNIIKSKFANNELVLFESKNILQTGALIKKCKLFITHDTGTRHLSVALKTPVLALLPEDNLKHWNFYNSNSHYNYLVGKRIVNENKTNGFLSGISVDEVLKSVNEILK